mgnify:CR=1 FL=1
MYTCSCFKSFLNPFELNPPNLAGLIISLVIVFVSAAVIAIQVSKQFLMTGAEAYVGGSIAIVMIREIAPGFVALAIGARAGTAISAEIANMKVTSQVDAIKTLKVDPVGYYFSPRILASAITVPMVVLSAELVGIVGGLIISYCTIGLHPARYINSVWLWLSTKDIYISLLKAFIFGSLIALVCATQGYKTTGGAKDVGISKHSGERSYGNSPNMRRNRQNARNFFKYLSVVY